MVDKPMLFSAPMVRALLEGRKTQTRRLIKWQGPKGYPHSFEHAIVDNPAGVQRLLVPFKHPDEADLPWGENGYHRHYGPADPGDRIWVKETWSHSGTAVWSISQARMAVGNGRVIYRADNDSEFPYAKYWPSIFLPKEFSRLTLHVTGVKIERLQSISEDDAVAEGISVDRGGFKDRPLYCVEGLPSRSSAVDAYEQLWRQINGGGSWDKNPWVVAITFEVERCNMAQARAA